MVKVRTLEMILNDPRIERVIKDYDGRGRHMVECKDGYVFESCSSTIEIGNIKELCDEINNRLIEKKYNTSAGSKREYFAATAMQGLLTRQENGSEPDLGILECKRIAEESVIMADTLIKALKYFNPKDKPTRP